MIFFWLDTPELAIERIKARVLEGGHNIPKNVIVRRYYSGVRNLFKLYVPLCDYWMIIDNSKLPSELIAEGYGTTEMIIKNSIIFDKIKKTGNNEKYEK